VTNGFISSKSSELAILTAGEEEGKRKQSGKWWCVVLPLTWGHHEPKRRRRFCTTRAKTRTLIASSHQQFSSSRSKPFLTEAFDRHLLIIYRQKNKQWKKKKEKKRGKRNKKEKKRGMIWRHITYWEGHYDDFVYVTEVSTKVQTWTVTAGRLILIYAYSTRFILLDYCTNW